MLQPAYPHREALGAAYSRVIVDDRFLYFQLHGYHDFEITIATSTWSKIQMVSLSPSGELLGYLAAFIDRDTYTVDNIAAANFAGEGHPVFARDLYRFLRSLFEDHRFEKIKFSSSVENPANRIYTRLIDRYGGREVGVFRNDARLPDGRLTDVVHYELLRKDYLKAQDR